MKTEAVTCPFCGLLCDDLVVAATAGTVTPVRNACGRSRAGFARAGTAALSSPTVNGAPASLEDAVAHAARLLDDAVQPAIAGLATDVNGIRAGIALAERCGAVIDHAGSEALMRNVSVLEEIGWFTGTLTEVRNRADLIVVIGAETLRRFPRFGERVLGPASRFVDGRPRHIVIVDDEPAPDLAGDGASADWLDAVDGVEHLTLERDHAPLDRSGDFASALRMALHGHEAPTAARAGCDPARVQALAERLRDAEYSAVVWSAGALDFPGATLAIQTLVEVVRDLNEKTRSVGLPLAGTLGDLTANQVCTWQTGFPLRQSFAGGVADYDPWRHDAARMAVAGEIDVMVWVSALDADLAPPPGGYRRIVIGHPAAAPGPDTEVFIPVGIPGIDHAGNLYRADSVVALPLTALRESPLPRSADVLDAIRAALTGDDSC